MGYSFNPEPSDQADRQTGDNLIAAVMSRGQIELESSELVASVLKRYDVAARVPMPTIAGHNGFVLEVDGTHVLVQFQNFPMPVDNIRAIHGEKRNADGPILDHRSHAVVSLLVWPENYAAKLRAALVLVQVIAAVAEGPGASAVLWFFSQTLLPIGQFQQLTAQWTAHPETVPMLLFIRVVSYHDGEEEGKVRLGIFGVGFKPFIGREIEFEPQPRLFQELLYAFELVSEWLLAKGLVFGDGDSCGTTHEEVIRVRHRDEGILLKVPVLLCRIEALHIPMN